MAVKSKIFINTSKYGDILADVYAGEIAANIASKAKRKVRVDTGNLASTINFNKKSKGEWEVFAISDYAAAQEWGLKPFGKDNYRFTPYMRPATQEAGSTGEKNIALKIAEAKALRGSRV